MMFLYMVTAAKADYDEYDAVAVIADSEEQALNMVKAGDDEDDDEGYFYEWQYPLSVKCICKCDATELKVVLASFYAG